MVDRDANRPDPDLLLEQTRRQEGRGRLKIFFGAAPGVGKTYAMLESAHARRKAGTDVVVGVIETHGRQDTAAKLEGLEVLPREREFALDLALERRPELILIDELAHTNADGSRHLKRWQDVEELLEAGIDVYSTLNVQHVESLNDVVAQITGVIVRETVPDHIVEIADEIELIDLPVEELIERLRAGKVYVPEQAERALENFFKPGNLNALREMALRQTAEHVDSNVMALRGASAGAKTWPVAERLVLAIGPSPYSQNLIRATKRLATQLEAGWIVMSVETSESNAEARAKTHEAMELAASLGAETVTVGGHSVAQAVLEYARLRNATRIVVGKSPGSKLVGALIEGSGDIAVIALDGGGKLERKMLPAVTLPRASELGLAMVWVAGATVLGLLLRDRIAQTNIVMVYLLAVVAISWRYSRETAVIAAVVSVASFDFFCVPPYFTFAFTDLEYVFTFGFMLMVSLVIGTLTVKLREQAAAAIDRENRAQSLFRLSRELADDQRLSDAAQTFAGVATAVMRTGFNVFLPDGENKVSFRRRLSNEFTPPAQEEGIAQWCLDHGQPAGKATATLPGATAQYRPIAVREKTLAVVAIEEPPTDPGQKALLDSLVQQTAIAMDRLLVQEEARQAAFAAEGERLRNSLLSAVSHDLRTPLTSIAGAASALLEQQGMLDEKQRRELLESIADESTRLNQLVANLLEITRLEDGKLRLRKEWCGLDEIVASVVEEFASERIAVKVDADLPLIEAEPQLLAQALRNLIENAIKYTPAGSRITVVAEKAGVKVRLAVVDAGPGIPPGDEEKVFEKFYRGTATSKVRGVGLGLAIVKSIAIAHGGSVRAMNRREGGAEFEILLNR